MNTPFLDLAQTSDGIQAIFAFQVFHRKPEDWLKMRWGFNAGALLEEALDRARLFVESQVASDEEFRSGVQPARTLALRGINLPGVGVQMAVLGKIAASNEKEIQKAGEEYARAIYSAFPHDFILVPVETKEEYHRLAGTKLLCAQPDVVQIQRRDAFVPSLQKHHFFPGVWQSSARSNEQIWRSLSEVSQQVMFNILLQPTFLYDGERKTFLEIKQQIEQTEQNTELTSAYIQWIQNIIKRRFAAWKKFFLLQVHVIAAGRVDENLLRSIGAALTRDTNDLPLPGHQIGRPESDTTEEWIKNLLSMDLTLSSRMEDLCDSDEASSVFRFPYLPEAGLPGANFIRLPQEPSSPVQTEQEH